MTEPETVYVVMQHGRELRFEWLTLAVLYAETEPGCSRPKTVNGGNSHESSGSI